MNIFKVNMHDNLMHMIKMGINLLMGFAAYHLISRGFAGGNVEPFMLTLIGILIVIEIITDIFHTH